MSTMTRHEAHAAMIQAITAKDAKALRVARNAFQATLNYPLTLSVEGETFVARAMTLSGSKYWNRTQEQIDAIWTRLASTMTGPWMASVMASPTA